MRPGNRKETWACDYDGPIQGEGTSPLPGLEANMAGTEMNAARRYVLNDLCGKTPNGPG